jgi:hypothetical protein
MSVMSPAATTAHQKLLTANPLTNFGTIVSINPLRISEKKPNVRMLIGRVRNLSIGRTSALSRPRARAAKIAVFGSVIEIAPMYRAMRYIARVSVAHLIMIFICLLYYIHSQNEIFHVYLKNGKYDTISD